MKNTDKILKNVNNVINKKNCCLSMSIIPKWGVQLDMSSHVHPVATTVH